MKDKKGKNTDPLDNFYFDHWKKSELRIFAEKNNIQLPKKIKSDKAIEIIRQKLPDNNEEIYVVYPAIENFIRNSVKNLTPKSLPSILFGISIIFYSLLVFFLFLLRLHPLYARPYIELSNLSPFIIAFYTLLIITWLFFKLVRLEYEAFTPLLSGEDEIYSELRNYCKNNSLFKKELIFTAFHFYGWFPRLTKWIDNEDIRETFQAIFMVAWILYAILIMFFFPAFIFIILGISYFLFVLDTYNNSKRDLLDKYISYSYRTLNKEILEFINRYNQKEEKTPLKDNILTFINEINDLLNLNIFGRASEGVEAWNISHEQSNLSIIHNLTYKFERFIQFLLLNEKVQLEPNKVKNLSNLIKSLRDELEFEMDKFTKIPKTNYIGGTLSFTSKLLYVIWMLIILTAVLLK